MADINTEGLNVQSLTASISASSFVVNEYGITITPTTNGYIMTIVKGGVTQTMTITNGETGPTGPQGPTGPAGTTKHSELEDRNLSNQHTMSAITGLESALAAKIETESDPTVPAWAKAAIKPTYTAAEVGALPSTASLADIPGDTTHRTVTDEEKAEWNGKSEFSGDYDDLTNKPTIPSKVSDLTNDSGFATQEWMSTNFETKAEAAQKVDKIEGKGLSTNDYTTTEKEKLAGLSNYTLPKASSAALGGVKADEILETDTQPVRIDSNGKLFTRPSSGGVTSVNGKTGAIQLTASDVDALPDSTVVPTKTSQLTNDSGFLTEHQSLNAYRTSAAQDVIDATKVNKVSGKDLSTNDYTNADKALVNSAYQKPTNGIPSTDLEESYYTEEETDNLFQKKNDSTLQTSTKTVVGGINELKTSIETNASKIAAIEGEIPSQASSSNQLADKEFVNSTVSTETAHYISNNGNPFTSVAQLEAYSGTVTNNDYAFVSGTDSEGNAYYDKYKATVPKPSTSSSIWAKEYRLNNSSFTAAQWAAIQSGITSTLTTKLSEAIEEYGIGYKYQEDDPAVITWNGVTTDLPYITKPSTLDLGNFYRVSQSWSFSGTSGTLYHYKIVTGTGSSSSEFYITEVKANSAETVYAWGAESEDGDWIPFAFLVSQAGASITIDDRTYTFPASSEYIGVYFIKTDEGSIYVKSLDFSHYTVHFIADDMVNLTAYAKKTETIAGVQVGGSDLTIDSNRKVNIPAANSSTLGAVKAEGSWTGIGINSSNTLFVVGAQPGDIDGRAEWSKPICPPYLPYAVKSAMIAATSTSDPAWTDAEKLAARTRMGAAGTDLAASSTAGLVKADAVTSADTQPVRIGSDGKLYTQPAESMYYTWTVTLTDADSAQPSSGISLNLYSGSSLVETKAYAGQPVSFQVVKQGEFKIEISGTWSGHLDPSPSSITLRAATSDSSFIITYSTISSMTTFMDAQAALNVGAFDAISIGTELTFTHATEGELIWEVVHKDSSDQSITLLMKNPFNSNMQFDAIEALYCAESAILPAGDYSFIKSGTTYYLTLTTDIPVGGQLVVTTSSFTTYSSPESTTVLETGTVSTTAISGATSLGTCGTNPLNHSDRILYGNNNYYYSNLAQWLNSNGAANSWFTHTHRYDRPPTYVNKPGFLAGIPSDVLACVASTTVKCSTNNTWEDSQCLYPKSTAYTVTQKFFLPSEMEIFGSYGGTADGSVVYDAYDGATAADRIKYTKGTSTARYWWLRSPSWTAAYNERYVGTSGAVDHYYAYNTYRGAAAACRIVKSN